MGTANDNNRTRAGGSPSRRDAAGASQGRPQTRGDQGYRSPAQRRGTRSSDASDAQQAGPQQRAGQQRPNQQHYGSMRSIDPTYRTGAARRAGAARASGKPERTPSSRGKRRFHLPEIHLPKFHLPENLRLPEKPPAFANLQVPIDLGAQRNRRIALGVAAAVLVVVVAVAAVSCSGGKKSEEAAEDDTAVEAVAYSPSTAVLDDIPSSAGLATFTLSSEDAPALSDEQAAAIEDAIAACEEYGDVGIVFYDVETGLGISYNADGEIYGSSSFIVPYMLYLCEDIVEGGTASLDDLSDSMESCISSSDAATYLTLRDTYDSVDYDSWVARLGCDDASYLEDSHYPWYCARTSAKLWTELYLYLQAGSDTAEWLEGVLGQTGSAFIASALADTDATVVSNGGAYAGSESKYDCVSDAALITLDGHTYVMSVMTYMPSSDTTQTLHTALCSALFDAHGALSGEGEDSAADDEPAEE